MKEKIGLFDFVEDTQYPEFYRICKNTGARLYLRSEKRNYGRSYFLEEYKNQYNKTYYEDEVFLREIANKRLRLLTKHCKVTSPQLLEIGCAAGFFLDEAKKKGFVVRGIEISERETEYAKSIGLDVSNSAFEDCNFQKEFDIVASFFVLEHFQDPEKSILKIGSILKKDGLFICALPSFNGPTFMTNPKKWFETHPKDHFIDYDLGSFSKVLKKLGLKIVYKKPFSYHKTRDLSWKGKFLSDSMYKTLADWTCYGDTIQIIAKKVEK